LAGLMLLGLAFVYSAAAARQASDSIPLQNQLWVRQLMWYAIGLGAAGALCLVDYHTLARWWLVAYWGSILLLIVVLIPAIGSGRGGAQRWLVLGPLQLQPSEVAKLALILSMAHYLSRPPEELKQRRVFWQAIGMILLPFMLILKEP